MEEEIIYCSPYITGETKKPRKRNFCIYEEWITRPSYNFEGNKKPSHCSKHKLDKMINVICSKCIYEECKKRSSYNYEGEIKSLFCSQH